MGNIWVALSWSAAVAPAYFAVQAVRHRLEPYGQFAELAAFGTAWYLFGSILSGVTRIVLELAGVPVGPKSDPAGELEQTRRRLAAGKISRAEAEVRMAACHIALGRPDEALACCDAADAAGARDTHAGQVRFFRGKALEAAGRRDEAHSVFQGIHRDRKMPTLFRAAARLQCCGLTGAETDGVAAADLAALLDAEKDDPPTADELIFLGEAAAEIASRPGAGPASAAVLDMLVTRAPSGRCRRALQRLRNSLPAK